ncbi:MAG: hypothetical protein Q9191_000531 [Dirinaria sp. TL-2023a]
MDDPAIVSAGRGSKGSKPPSSHTNLTAQVLEAQGQPRSQNLRFGGRKSDNAFEDRIAMMIQGHNRSGTNPRVDDNLTNNKGSVSTNGLQRSSVVDDFQRPNCVEGPLPKQPDNNSFLSTVANGHNSTKQAAITPPQRGSLPAQHTANHAPANSTATFKDSHPTQDLTKVAPGSGASMPASAQIFDRKAQPSGYRPSRDPRAHTKPNQKQRRQGATSLQYFDPSSSIQRASSIPDQYNPQQTMQSQQMREPTAQYQSTNLPPHLRAIQQQSARQDNHGWNHAPKPERDSYSGPPALQPTSYPPTLRTSRAQSYQQSAPVDRSNHRQRQLFDPHSDRRPTFSQNGDWMVSHALKNQSDFLDQLASSEVPKAQIGYQELTEKQNLRLKLQKVCQETILEFELVRNPNFDGRTISLECFGSLGSGFAIAGSDMDLALLSPLSHPEPASNESEIPRLLEKRLLDLGYGARLLTRTRVPIIRFCEKPTPGLAEAMREARLRWETEKEAPPKPKTTKKDKKANAVEATAADASRSKDDDNSNEALGQQQAPSPTVNSVDEASTSLETLRISELSTATAFKAVNSISDKIINEGQKDQKLQSVDIRTDDELVRLYGLAMKEGWFDTNERSVIFNFVHAVKLHGADTDQGHLKQARAQLHILPDVLGRYREPHVNPLDLPKSGVGIQCDINFSNQLALHNTSLLRCYTLCDPRVTPMVIFVKAWTKRRKINSPYHGTLSSYGYVLMVLHYLMNVIQPPVIPNLQNGPYLGDSLVIDGYNVCFWRDEHDIQRIAASGGLTHNHSDTVGSLLRGFFKYFAHPSDGGFQWNLDVLSLRTPGGLLRKQDKGWTGAKTVTVESNVPGEEAKEVRHRYLFAIEDPFELEHNIARTVVHNGIVAIRDEFRRAHRIVQAHSRSVVTTREEMLAEAESKEHLQYRYFGPVIPDFGKKKDAPKASGEQDAKPGSAKGDRQIPTNAQEAKEVTAAAKANAQAPPKKILGQVNEPSQVAPVPTVRIPTYVKAAGTAVVTTEYQ